MMKEHRESVLVVDDEEPVLDLLKAMLQDEYDVDCAKDADEALRLVGGKEYDAVIADIALPGKLNGFELVEEISRVSPETKRILITGLALDEKSTKRAMAVADGLLAKPFDMYEITSLLRKDLRLERMPHGA
ncbi:MAG TPA: response regulator [Planctomycetota bacterium]|nr:response regulator [Planctomycetota bacterium]